MSSPRTAAATAGSVVVDGGMRSVFTERAAGNVSLTVGAPDPTARGGVGAAIGVEPDELVFMDQVHGAAVTVVGVDDRGRGLTDQSDAIAACDALVTFDVDVALVVLVADCVPVIISDPGRAVAAVHAGRAGVVDGVIAAAVEAMELHDPATLTAVIGPAIGGCCYEVESDLADAVAARVPGVRSRTTWATPSLDLPAAVTWQLAARGVERVSRVGACTMCSTARWFSHRRAAGGGRQAGVVVRRPTVAGAGGST